MASKRKDYIRTKTIGRITFDSLTLDFDFDIKSGFSICMIGEILDKLKLNEEAEKELRSKIDKHTQLEWIED